MIVPALLALFTLWRPHFADERTWRRAVRHALTHLASLGRGTITGLLRAMGQTETPWHADYRLYSQRPWAPDALFNTLLQEALPYTDPRRIVIGLDDTGVPKTGKRIPFVTWGRDPLSPPFHTNLRRQLRFVHAVILLPLYDQGAKAARAIPVRFTCAPPPPKPPRGEVTAEAMAAHRAEVAAAKLPAVGRRLLEDLRRVLDALGQQARPVLAVMDGSYCNATLFREGIAGVDLLARCRKSIRLCHRYHGVRRRFYGTRTFTPDEVRLDADEPWQSRPFWFGGALQGLRYKDLGAVYWRTGARKRPLRLLVLAATPYRRRRRGKLNYREPAYLLTTDLTSPATPLIQAYLDRWQIEMAHREEKTALRLGQAQVRTPKAVERQPAFTVAVYGALLLAALQRTGGTRPTAAPALPAWYTWSARASVEDLVRLVRADLLDHPDLTAPFDLSLDARTLLQAAAA